MLCQRKRYSGLLISIKINKISKVSRHLVIRDNLLFKLPFNEETEIGNLQRDVVYYIYSRYDWCTKTQIWKLGTQLPRHVRYALEKTLQRVIKEWYDN